jgi:predicted metalloprotease with PDZ domain
MSKPFNPIFLIAFCLTQILHFSNSAYARQIEIELQIRDSDVLVTGKFTDKKQDKKVTHFSFLSSFAGQENLGKRFYGFDLRDEDGRQVSLKKLNDNEFLAEKGYFFWSYRGRLNPLNPAAMAHTSWLADGRGILMLADLLPQFEGEISAKIFFQLPEKWRVVSNEKKLSENVFEVSKIEKAVFYVGNQFRELLPENRHLNFLIDGEFLFDDRKAAKMALEIFENYQRLFGGIAHPEAKIFLLRFPKDVKAGRWEAETRGSSVVILSADMLFSTHSEQKLHEQLRHEIFHLWIPNGLNLTGNYDWFFEGFALYQSLRTGLDLNRLRFEDFLDTLGRAYDIDSFQMQKKSLLEASKNRWSGANTQIYARGMLTAFLIDLAILKQSGGKDSLIEIFREVYQKHNYLMPQADGNTTILKILESRQELRPVIEKYIRGEENIAWGNELEFFGIESTTENSVTRLKVKNKLNRRQRDLLDKLGYNNWRRFLQKSK